VFDALEADLDRALGLTCDVLTTPERLGLLQRWEGMRRVGAIPCPWLARC
jgi:hypothetical protein